MAKKAKTSARSKGYRKTEKKRPFLTKKEIIYLVIIVAAIALALILGFLLYDDGSLDVVDGVVQTENLDSSLIVNAGSKDEPKYFKIGEVGELEGYTRERTDGLGTTYASFYYYPEDEASDVEYLYVAPGAKTPVSMAQTSYISSMSSTMVLGSAGEGIQEIDIDGRHFYYLITQREGHPVAETTEDGSTDATASAAPVADATAEIEPEATQDATAAPEIASTETTAETEGADATAEEEPADATEEEPAEPYVCEQTLTAFTSSDLNDDYSILLRVRVSGESEAGLDEEGLAAFTEDLYLSEEELLDYLRQLLPAVFPEA